MNKAKVSNARGTIIGYFLNPSVENLCGADYKISGTFVDELGHPFAKAEFNPQIMPYIIDLSEVSQAKVKKLFNAYVQRGRQPVAMTASSLNQPTIG